VEINRMKRNKGQTGRCLILWGPKVCLQHVRAVMSKSNGNMREEWGGRVGGGEGNTRMGRLTLGYRVPTGNVREIIVNKQYGQCGRSPHIYEHTD